MVVLEALCIANRTMASAADVFSEIGNSFDGGKENLQTTVDLWPIVPEIINLK